MTELELQVERPAPGGRMIARHDGRIVFVAGAIPGERVLARLERTRGKTLFAVTTAVLERSPDRRDPGADPACGGRDLAHITLARQRALKAEIIVDAFRRLARCAIEPPLVHGSPEYGYRMRARLHVRHGRPGFYREGTHSLCDAAAAGQLGDEAIATLRQVETAMAGRAIDGSLELAENRDGSERAVLLDLAPQSQDRGPIEGLLDIGGVSGIGVLRGGDPLAGRGSPVVADELQLSHGEANARVHLQHHVAAFFQGNRFLLQSLVERVLAHVPEGPLLDLYAGVGLFGVSHAALGRGPVIAVEGDAVAAADLAANARPHAAVQIEESAVEAALLGRSSLEDTTVLVDPPRTGLSDTALRALLALRPPVVVYVSCDVATLSRDVARMTGAGFGLCAVEAFDLFPGTPHVETLAVLSAGPAQQVSNL